MLTQPQSPALITACLLPAAQTSVWLCMSLSRLHVFLSLPHNPVTDWPGTRTRTHTHPHIEGPWSDCEEGSV